MDDLPSRRRRTGPAPAAPPAPAPWDQPSDTGSRRALRDAERAAAQRTPSRTPARAQDGARAQDVTRAPRSSPPPAPGAPAAPQRDGGPRAGRNLPAAVAVGLGLGALVLGSLFVRKEAFVVLVALAVVVAVWELASAFSARRLHVPLVPVVVGSVGILVSAYAAGEEALLVAFGLTCFGLVVWRVLEGVDGAVRDVAAGVFSAAYVPFLAGFAMLMLAPDDGPRRIVVFMLVVIASDIGGYAAGVAFGRHPMAPSVSPKKSWEGFAGSAVACLVVGVVAVVLLLDGSWWAGALVGLAAVVTATGGDLTESLLKRDLGIKDMGSVLPGHGGVMDRLDSLLPTAPVVYLLLATLVPVST